MRTINKNKLTTALCAVLVLLISTSSVFALPPDPENAALLYYQAFLLYQRPDDTMKDMIADLAKGKIEPNTRVTEFIESQKAVIELVVTATELPKCTWGYKYSKGLDVMMPHLSQAKHLTWLIISDARIAAAEGNYELAIDRCLTAHKMALHIAQEPTFVSFLVDIAIERRANKCIQDILSTKNFDLDKLQYLREQLDDLDNRAQPMQFYLDTEREVMAMYMTTERMKEILSFCDEWDMPESQKISLRELILAADEQFCQRNADYYNEYWTNIFSSFDLSYPQAYLKLKKIDEELAKEVNVNKNPDAILTCTLAPATQKIHNLDVQRKTFSNALKTALEIYIINAQTGRLPDSLPSGLPNDLFSGKPFEYEKTDDGFILRCQGKDLDKDEIHEYEFKVKK